MIKEFVVHVAAVIVGVFLIGLMYSAYAADSDTKNYCDNTTGNPFAQTNCIVRETLK